MAMTELNSEGLIFDGDHPNRMTGVEYPDFGEQRLYRFPNGFGASVVNSRFITNGAPYELAVLKYDGVGDRDWGLTYDTAITSDVERGDADDINAMLAAIAALETEK